MAGGRITVQLASCMLRCIMLQDQDGHWAGTQPSISGLTDGQFPYMPRRRRRFPLPC